MILPINSYGHYILRKKCKEVDQNIDYLSPLTKRLLKNKLKNISLGKVKVDYKMRFIK